MHAGYPAVTGSRGDRRAGLLARLEGEHLARRATEIVGRVDTAAAELSAMVGLRTRCGPGRST
jgi:hypothetical protein